MTHPTRTDWRTVWTIALGILAGTIAAVGTVAVAVAGFTLSYDAIRTVGISAHIRTGWAWLLPVSVDGAMAVATVAAVVVRQVTGRTAYYPWLVVLVGAVISIACNGLHATGQLLDNDAVRFAVSAIPALMLTLSVHLLVTLVLLSRRETTPAPDVAPDVAVEGVSHVAPTAVPPQVAAPVAVAADVAPPDTSQGPTDVAESDTTPAGVVSLFRPYVVAEADTDTDTSRDTSVSQPAASNVAPKVASGDRPMSRKVSRQGDTDAQKIARRRVARGDSCASVARDLDVSAKTVERWTADIRARRAGATSDSDTKPVNGSSKHPDLAGVTS